MDLLKLLFRGRPQVELKQFSGVRIRFLVIDGEEGLFTLLKEVLSRNGVAILPARSTEATHELSFWTTEMNPGVPILWGVRLILRTTGGVTVADQLIHRQFLTEKDFTAYVARWVVTRLEISP